MLSTVLVTIILSATFFLYGKVLGEDSEISSIKAVSGLLIGALILGMITWAYTGQPMTDSEGFIISEDGVREFESLSPEGKSFTRLKTFVRVFLGAIIPGLLGFGVGRHKVEKNMER